MQKFLILSLLLLSFQGRSDELLRPKTFLDYLNQEGRFTTLELGYRLNPDDLEVAYIFPNSLQRDFPETEKMDHQTLQRWLKSKVSVIGSLQNLLNGIRNTDFHVDPKNRVLILRPSGWIRSGVVEVVSDTTGEVTGTMDIKGIGHGAPSESEIEFQRKSFNDATAKNNKKGVDALRITGHSDGLMTLGEAIAEVTRQQAAQMLFELLDFPLETVEIYGIVKLPFDIIKDGEKCEPAALLIRQSHIGRSSGLPVPPSIYIDDHGGLQSTENDVAVDFGGVIITEPRLSKEFKTVDGSRDPQKSQAWLWGHDTGRAFIRERNPDKDAVYRHVHDMLSPIENQYAHSPEVKRRKALQKSLERYVRYLQSKNLPYEKVRERLLKSNRLKKEALRLLKINYDDPSLENAWGIKRVLKRSYEPSEKFVRLAINASSTGARELALDAAFSVWKIPPLDIVQAFLQDKEASIRVSTMQRLVRLPDLPSQIIEAGLKSPDASSVYQFAQYAVRHPEVPRAILRPLTQTLELTTSLPFILEALAEDPETPVETYYAAYKLYLTQPAYGQERDLVLQALGHKLAFLISQKSFKASYIMDIPKDTRRALFKEIVDGVSRLQKPLDPELFSRVVKVHSVFISRTNLYGRLFRTQHNNLELIKVALNTETNPSDQAGIADNLAYQDDISQDALRYFALFPNEQVRLIGLRQINRRNKILSKEDYREILKTSTTRDTILEALEGYTKNYAVPEEELTPYLNRQDLYTPFYVLNYIQATKQLPIKWLTQLLEEKTPNKSESEHSFSRLVENPDFPLKMLPKILAEASPLGQALIIMGLAKRTDFTVDSFKEYLKSTPEARLRLELAKEFIKKFPSYENLLFLAHDQQPDIKGLVAKLALDPKMFPEIHPDLIEALFETEEIQVRVAAVDLTTRLKSVPDSLVKKLLDSRIPMINQTAVRKLGPRMELPFELFKGVFDDSNFALSAKIVGLGSRSDVPVDFLIKTLPNKSMDFHDAAIHVLLARSDADAMAAKKTLLLDPTAPISGRERSLLFKSLHASCVNALENMN